MLLELASWISCLHLLVRGQVKADCCGDSLRHMPGPELNSCRSGAYSTSGDRS